MPKPQRPTAKAGGPSASPNGAARGPPATAGSLTVAGIGASAGGLEACTRLLASLPASSGIAFILVQHLDPTHDSMMADLLSSRTKMQVQQATDGMVLQANHFYIIPPAAYLSVRGGHLRLSAPQARHGARLPFDFLLASLAEEFGKQAIGVVMSGTGSDGCLGLKTVKERGGLVIAQDPVEAGYDGMPRNAIATGLVDLVLPASDIPAAMLRYASRIDQSQDGSAHSLSDQPEARLAEIIDLLRKKAAHDFTLYKPGTLRRRIIRRMAMAEIDSDSMDVYLTLLRNDPRELDLLAKDLLINVTSFFRDPKVFETLERTVIPELIASHAPDRGLRIWVAGCSTGEETYSLAMILREQVMAAQSDIKLQLFASDIDGDAVATAREGLYPASIVADVSPERLARYFTRDDHGYRVTQDLRSSVVFTVQDVLADPPFSRLDMVSCRNLLIYLRPEAQAQVIAMFDFALREGGVLLLGSAETVGQGSTSFEIISKPDRLYRHVGHSRPGEYGAFKNAAANLRLRAAPGQAIAPTRPTDLAELGRRLVLDAFAPAAVLINRKRECLFSLGPIDRYLRVPTGHASHDLLALARPGLRNRLSLAIQQATEQRAPVVTSGGRIVEDGHAIQFQLDVRPVASGGEDLLLICFIDGPKTRLLPGRDTAAGEVPRMAELQQELEATRAELKRVIRDLEASTEEQKAVHEEALSVNEEHQSTNEELLTSKEELQSLNEELTALNSQLQETLERQRKTADDLQNVLYSTDIPTLFLDEDLKIRFFTPATRLIFNVIPTDIGRPLQDLRSLVPDRSFAEDAAEVLSKRAPAEREIEAPDGVWFTRRIMPYRTQKSGGGGLVITFTDITERKRAARALLAAQEGSDSANVAKSRFLAAASHDLRQPLQTLALLQGLLSRSGGGARNDQLVERFGETVAAMSGMLNTLLDINQIDAGVVRAEFTEFRLDRLFDRLREEMTYQAEAQQLRFRVVPCGQTIRSDPALLEQMIRNLISNAFKYTRTGKVLLGCRRFGGVLRIEVWDTGIGIAEAELQAIFAEYHQLDNAARERSRGLGLGLSIVQRLGDLLGHTISVRSRPGRGSVFGIDVVPVTMAATPPRRRATDSPLPPAPHRTGTILLVEDDPNIAELLEIFLKGEGHRVTTQRDGVAAVAYLEHAALRPDLILTDYNLPNQLDGLQLAIEIRRMLHRKVPAIILTGDISKDTLRNVVAANCAYMSKPVKLPLLAKAVQDNLPPESEVAGARSPGGAASSDAPVVFLIDDDIQVRESIGAVLEANDRIVQSYEDGESFLRAHVPGRFGCVLIDEKLPGMSGLELLRRLRLAGDRIPAIMITGNGDVPMAVQAMKVGADDFIEKPIAYQELLDSIDTAIAHSRDATKRAAWRETAASQLSDLTPRQHDILQRVLAGQPSKNIAADLGISQRTVENHRASIMKRTGATSLPALARLVVIASLNAPDMHEPASDRPKNPLPRPPGESAG